MKQNLFAESVMFASAYNYTQAEMHLPLSEARLKKARSAYDEALAALQQMKADGADPESFEYLTAEKEASSALSMLSQAEAERDAWADCASATKDDFAAWLAACTEENTKGFSNLAGNVANVLRLFVSAEFHNPAQALEEGIFTTEEAAALSAALHKCVFSYSKDSGRWTAGKEDYVKVKDALQALFDKFAMPVVGGEVLRKAKFDAKAETVNAVLAQYVLGVEAEYKKDGDGMPEQYTGELVYKTSIYARKKGGKTVYGTAAIRKQIAELLFAQLGRIMSK